MGARKDSRTSTWITLPASAKRQSHCRRQLSNGGSAVRTTPWAPIELAFVVRKGGPYCWVETRRRGSWPGRPNRLIQRAMDCIM